MKPELLAPAMMIASGSIHAVVNAILKGGRAIIDGSSALILPPATLVDSLLGGDPVVRRYETSFVKHRRKFTPALPLHELVEG
ncbi:hypothetical protein ACQKOH_06100 [Sphingomonas sp. NPDC092331]|uniref:hypothetical protein n=1 Tax=unclassified Sphingomonas TaxID=196159 RepID=UPI0029F05A6E|nr:hypothetical protein [Pseudomonadota bacterium]